MSAEACQGSTTVVPSTTELSLSSHSTNSMSVSPEETELGKGFAQLTDQLTLMNNQLTSQLTLMNNQLTTQLTLMNNQLNRQLTEINTRLSRMEKEQVCCPIL
jgi:DNA anti-recombination protein RmuC